VISANLLTCKYKHLLKKSLFCKFSKLSLNNQFRKNKSLKTKKEKSPEKVQFAHLAENKGTSALLERRVVRYQLFDIALRYDLNIGKTSRYRISISHIALQDIACRYRKMDIANFRYRTCDIFLIS